METETKHDDESCPKILSIFSTSILVNQSLSPSFIFLLIFLFLIFIFCFFFFSICIFGLQLRHESHFLPRGIVSHLMMDLHHMNFVLNHMTTHHTTCITLLQLHITLHGFLSHHARQHHYACRNFLCIIVPHDIPSPQHNSSSCPTPWFSILPFLRVTPLLHMTSHLTTCFHGSSSLPNSSFI